jgi:hypothetical protein
MITPLSSLLHMFEKDWIMIMPECGVTLKLGRRYAKSVNEFKDLRCRPKFKIRSFRGNWHSTSRKWLYNVVLLYSITCLCLLLFFFFLHNRSRSWLPSSELLMTETDKPILSPGQPTWQLYDYSLRSAHTNSTFLFVVNNHITGNQRASPALENEYWKFVIFPAYDLQLPDSTTNDMCGQNLRELRVEWIDYNTNAQPAIEDVVSINPMFHNVFAMCLEVLQIGEWSSQFEWECHSCAACAFLMA